jgi:hypothetical protein
MFLGGSGVWTIKLEQAQSFAGIEPVLSALHQYQLRDCDLVLQFGDIPSKEYDIILPLGYASGALREVHKNSLPSGNLF